MKHLKTYVTIILIVLLIGTFTKVNAQDSSKENTNIGTSNSVKENENIETEKSNQEFIPYTDISLNKTKINLVVGEKFQLVPTVAPENATEKNVMWFSSDYNVVKVLDGELEAVAEGKAVVFAEPTGGNEGLGVCEVTVTKPTEILASDKDYIPYTDISLNKTKVDLVVGEKFQLVPTVTPENSTEKNVMWLSSDYNVVKVLNGELEAVAEGKAVVFAEHIGGNEGLGVCEVTVTKPTDISKCKIEGIVPTYYTGKKVKLNLKITDGENTLAANKDYKVTYKNNINEGNATVVITGINHYTGKLTKTFKIIKKPNISNKINYYITSAYSNGRALDLKNGSTKTGNNVVTKTLSCGKLQKFIIGNNSDGTYYIQNVASKKYLGVNDNYTGKAKTKVTLKTSNKTPGTKWYIAQNSDSTISFYTKDGFALEVLENNNTNIQINKSSNSNLQKFIITKTDSISAASISTTKTYYIVSSIDTKKAIDIYAAGTADCTNVDIYDLNKTSAQSFSFKKNSDGSYTIINTGSNKVIDVAENKTDNKTNVNLYTSNDTTAQKWYAIKNLDGTITFLSAESGKALDLYAADTKNFNNIDIWDWNHTDAQKWKLIN